MRARFQKVKERVLTNTGLLKYEADMTYIYLEYLQLNQKNLQLYLNYCKE